MCGLGWLELRVFDFSHAESQPSIIMTMFRQRRFYATKSPYSTLYSGTFPAMVPVFLLGSAVYYVCHFVLK